MTEFATIVFADMRGFTAWSRDTEVTANLPGFVRGFSAILQAEFRPPAWFHKGLGDGAMLVRELPDDAEPAAVLTDLVQAIDKVEQAFVAHQAQFARRFGLKAELMLGWGITRGQVLRTAEPQDYLGANVNKAARLCDFARPFGIAIDKDDFAQLPEPLQARCRLQTRKAPGIGEVDVWVTQEIATQAIPREKVREKPEVHVAGICVREVAGQTEILLARRSRDRALFPGLIEGCGGQLRYSEPFEAGVRRHFRDEMGVEVEVLPDLHGFYEIRESEAPVIPGIRFLCRYVRSLRDSIGSPHHSEVWWSTLAEMQAIPRQSFIDGWQQEVVALVQRATAQGVLTGAAPPAA